MKRFYLFFLLVAFASKISAQNVSINTDGSAALPSALLDVKSTTKGALLPRMTAVQRIAISSPAQSLIVYDTDSASLFIYHTVTGWKPIKSISVLGDLIPGTALGDILVWNGSVWISQSKCTLYTTYYPDKDGDGLGDRYFPILGCNAVTGLVTNNSDCNDNDPTIGVIASVTWYRDADGDGYGNSAISTSSCSKPPGYVSNATDCNDANANVNPGAAEKCNAIDDNCNGQIDDPFLPVNGGNLGQSCSVGTGACARSNVYVCHSGGLSTICNASPGAPGAEICNGIDDNCDGMGDWEIPDELFADGTCDADNIDGTETVAIFVATSGNDGNAGTRAAPKKTINAGIAAAIAGGKIHVYISEGQYYETVNLANGIGLYGGYSAVNSWVRGTAYKTEILGTNINGDIIGVIGNNVNADFVRISVNTKLWKPNPQKANYGLFLSNCNGLAIKNCTIAAGEGGFGINGDLGSDGQDGMFGADGLPGSCNTNVVATGGASVIANTCISYVSGNGGNGGYNNTSGTSGGIGVGNYVTTPASGGNFGAIGLAGQNGSIGSNGISGNNGAVSSTAGSFNLSGYWLASTSNSGLSGTNGASGNGGGGGGGGTTAPAGTGNGGGSGGAGGCGGTGGAGGGAGGASVGIMLVNTNLINSISSSTITSSSGGRGGFGGDGGSGGIGGSGGLGGTTCIAEVGAGGNGGKGGDGGNGGHGAGGNGGPSYGVYRLSSTFTNSGSTITAGAPSLGGTSSGNAGNAGLSIAIF